MAEIHSRNEVNHEIEHPSEYFWSLCVFLNNYH
ncbi:MAG: hypothetical protein EZS26_003133 [Candidatus Ordinivivax streblomastigis]|uniref:Uncharacterized protein n=1 Tax=Candidatus Ordinivivax streblomastigis TaxID=2540710 RepID=A0A5M8NV42_9BACT|nr:MAG: hypothetical protein EZS26_003133 [Candidatus Ordinivivax streblomastigis]